MFGLTGGRRQFYGMRWPRKEDGPALPRDPPPTGYRPPNGLIWGHDMSEFCWIMRWPKLLIQTMWSRSMIREFGELFSKHLENIFFDNPHIDPKPRRRRPWPVLKALKGKVGKVAYDPPLGFIDEGSDHDEANSWDAVLQDSDDEESGTYSTAPEFSSKKECVYIPLSAIQTPWWKDVKQTLVSVSNKPRRVRFVVRRPSKVPKRKQIQAKPTSEDDGEDADDEGDDSMDVDPNPLSVVSSGVFSDSGADGNVSEPSEPPNASNLSDMYSLDGIAVLQEHIPEAHFPDNLVVHDPFDVSMGHLRDGPSRPNHKPSSPAAVLYRRVYPAPGAFSRSKSRRNVGHLYLSPENKAGIGHHSVVYAAPFRLPTPLSTFNSASARPGTARIMAKVAIQNEFARELLRNEGEIYDSFPRFMSEEWCGWHLLSPQMQSPVPSVAVTPKFYGYYVPIERPGDSSIPSWRQRSPIMLVEDCGKPITACKLSVDERYVPDLLFILDMKLTVDTQSRVLFLADASSLHGICSQLLQGAQYSRSTWPLDCSA